MMRAFPALALVSVLVVVACASDDGDPDATAPLPGATANVSSTPAPADCDPARSHAPGESRETIASGGIDRQYVLRIPDDYAGEAAIPLVFVFHASGGTAQGMAELTALGTEAGQRGWITVFPQGAGAPPQWNAEALPAAADDVGFVRDMIAALQASLCIDPARVYATGYSNGGAMGLRAACALPDVFGAVAPVSAPFPSCQAAVPIIAFHGSQDGTVPYEGGVTADGRGHAPVHRLVSQWASAIGCDALPVISRAAMDVELATYARCPHGDNEALLYTVIGGGHTWPGAEIDYPVEEAGLTTHAIRATELILDFFASHRRP